MAKSNAIAIGHSRPYTRDNQRRGRFRPSIALLMAWQHRTFSNGGRGGSVNDISLQRRPLLLGIKWVEPGYKVDLYIKSNLASGPSVR